MESLGPSRAPVQARAFLGVGSSLDPEENVPAALGLLLGTPGVEITGISTFYRTPPLPAPGASPDSVAGHPEFLNGVVEIRTLRSPEEITEVLGNIENALGRVRTQDKYAPRTLDLDLLVYRREPGQEGGDVEKRMQEPHVYGDTGPPAHPDVRSRAWVALPLLELAPELELPPDGEPLREVARQFETPGGTVDREMTKLLRRRFLPQPRGP